MAGISITGAAERQPQVSKEMQTLEKTLCLLGDRLGELRCRLSTVMRNPEPVAPCASEINKAQVPNICTLAIGLSERRVQVDSYVAQIEGIIALLEL